MKSVSLLVLVACLLPLVGCKKGNRRDPNKLYVVATTGMLADAVAVVGGKHVHVDGLMGPGVDPHLYKATASDTRKLAEAQLVIYNGLHLEGKMQEILKKMGSSRPVVAATDRIPRSLLRRPPGFKGFHDPHVWFDVSLWQRVVERVRDALIKVDPKHSADYRTNAEGYLKQLKALHTRVRTEIGRIPVQKRYLVTSHDAFGYFGKAYGVKVIGLQGISTVSEAGVKDVERVVDQLVKSNITAIFVETSVSNQAIKAVIQGAKARGHKVVVGGSLFSDAMGKRGTPEGTYLGMVRHNLRTFVRAVSKK